MTTSRPALVALALALTGLGYGTPWVLSMLHDAPQVPQARVGRAGPERVVRLVLRPEPEPEPPVAESATEAPVPEAPTGAGAQDRDGPGPPDPLYQLGPAPDHVPRIAAGSLARGLQAQVQPQQAPARKGRKGRRHRKRTCEPDLAEIAQVSDHAFRIEDTLVAFYAGHPLETEKLASTWWNRDEDGERDGFKVGRVRCGTLLHQMGLRSGDAIMAINGKKIQSYADGLTAYMRVRQKQLFWVDVVRRGEPLRLDFLLVEDGAAEPAGLADGLDPTMLVEQQLALGELPWLQRRRGRRAQRGRMREAAASTRDLGLPGMAELGQLGQLPDEE